MISRLAAYSIAAWLVLLTPALAQEKPFTVTLLGTGRPDPAIDRFGPSTLIEAGTQRLLFDVGRGATQRLWQLRIPLGQVNSLFLTHLHSDHVVGIPDLWLTGWLPTPFGRRTQPMEVWGPAGTEEMMAALRTAYEWDIRVRGRQEGLPQAGISIRAHNIIQGVIYERDGVKVTAFDVDHGGFLKPAFGYRVDYAGRSVVISGDTRVSANLVRFAKGADVVIHEVAAVRPELFRQSATARRILDGHTQPEEAGNVFSQIKPRLAVYSHVVLLTTDASIPEPTIEELVARTRATYSGPLAVGEDLMAITIGDVLDVRRFAAPAP